MTDTAVTSKIHHYLNSRNIKIPEDVSLVSISNGSLPKLMYPNTTHFYHSAKEVDQLPTNLLFKTLKSKVPLVENIRIECPLIELNTVKNLTQY